LEYAEKFQQVLAQITPNNGGLACASASIPPQSRDGLAGDVALPYLAG